MKKVISALMVVGGLIAGSSCLAANDQVPFVFHNNLAENLQNLDIFHTGPRGNTVLIKLNQSINAKTQANFEVFKLPYGKHVLAFHAKPGLFVCKASYETHAGQDKIHLDNVACVNGQLDVEMLSEHHHTGVIINEYYKQKAKKTS